MIALKHLKVAALLAGLASLGAAAVLFGIDRPAPEGARAAAAAPSAQPDGDPAGGSGAERTFGSPRRVSFL